MKRILTLIAILFPAFTMANEQNYDTAIFAGGCFWCIEKDFEAIDGIIEATSGYTGGHLKNPSYGSVSAGGTGHTEAIEVQYDPNKITYAQLLEVFWRNIDPVDAHGQFCDKGTQYRSGIFYKNEQQRLAAEESKAQIDKSKTLPEPIVTEITKASEFYPAEDYHQDYYKKNPVRYKTYRFLCGRDKRLQELWNN